MNDKFLEILSKSSGRTITRPYDGSLLIKLDLPELEKFAELIIKECSKQVRNIPTREEYLGGQIFKYVQVGEVVDSIKLHFGVVDEW